MSESACENLPQELIAAIVDNIRDDKKSLKAFSLVRKAWTDPARYHLFASLTIVQVSGLQVASTFAPFLRHLHLASWDHQFWHEFISFLTDFKTPRLRSLVLIDFAWHSLSPPQRSTFLHSFESIISLQLSLYEQTTSSDIAIIVCSFPHLQKLILLPSMRKRELPGPPLLPPEIRVPERLSTLRVLYVYLDYRPVLEWLGSVPEQLSIHTVHLTMGSLLPQDLDAINMFLKAMGPSLEVFAYDYPGDEHPSIDLTHNTRLRCINFRFGRPESVAQDVSFVMSTLSRIGSRQLEQVAFHFTGPDWDEWHFPNSEWIGLDVMLAGSRFATLKDVHICTPPNSGDCDARRGRNIFTTATPVFRNASGSGWLRKVVSWLE